MIVGYKQQYPKDIVRVNDPPISARAAYIWLVKKLLKESGYERYDYIKWLAIRDTYLNKLKEQYGILWCEYCGTYVYLIKNKNPSKTNKVATIDHYIPLALGGAVYDPSNFAVACWPCNQKFGCKNKKKSRRKYPYSIEALNSILYLHQGESYVYLGSTEKQREDKRGIHLESSYPHNLSRLNTVLS
jgi:5-methylcytosine-specific restriction endonuclease McrA